MNRLYSTLLLALAGLLFAQTETLTVRVALPPGSDPRVLAEWGLPLARDPLRGTVLLETDEQGLAALAAAGFQVAVDAALTWPLPTSSKQGAGVPGYPCYPTNAEVFSQLSQWAAQYPDLVQIEDIGDSWEKTEGLGGADLAVLVLSNHQVPGPKPALFVCSGLHARELSPTGATMAFAESLLSGYGQAGDPTWLLDTIEIHLLILGNPDGRAYVEQPSPISWRKNTDNDFCTGTNSRGVDLNRNYSFQWGLTSSCSSTTQCSNTFRGPAAGSEPEIQAIQSYLQSIFPDQRGPGLGDPAPANAEGVFIDLHSFGGQVLWPYGFNATVAPNSASLTTLGRKFAWYNGYSPEKASVSFDTCGTSDDFNYGELGVAAFTFEMGASFFEPCANFNDTIWPDNSQALLYAAKVARAPYLWPSGPNAEDGEISSTTLVQGRPLRLAAVLRDDRFQAATNPPGVEPVQAVSGGEVYADGAPWEGGTPVAMTPLDGFFDSAVEAAELRLDTAAMPLGRHVLLVRGSDTSGAVGAPTGLLVDLVDGTAHLALSGRVVEIGTNAPLAAMVSCGGETAYCDPLDGRFYLAVPPGTHDLVVQLEGYNPASLSGITGSAGQALSLAQVVLVPVCESPLAMSAGGWASQGGWTLVADERDRLVWDDSPDGEYEDASLSRLTSPPLRLPQGGEALLDHRFRLDPFSADEALVEVSVDGGPWRRSARFHGDGTDWRETRIALPPGERVQLRFVLHADEAFGADGWQLGALTIKAGGSCVLPLLFANWPNDGITVLQIINYL